MKPPTQPEIQDSSNLNDVTPIPVKKERILRTFNRSPNNSSAKQFRFKSSDLIRPIRVNRLARFHPLPTPPPSSKEGTMDEIKASPLPEIPSTPSKIPVPPPMPRKQTSRSLQQEEDDYTFVKDIKEQDWYKEGVSIVDSLFKEFNISSEDVISKMSDADFIDNSAKKVVNDVFNAIFKSDEFEPATNVTVEPKFSMEETAAETSSEPRVTTEQQTKIKENPVVESRSVDVDRYTMYRNKEFADMTNDWIKFNQDLSSKTQLYSKPPMAAGSTSSQFASYSDSGFSNSLLNNQDDVISQEAFQQDKNQSVKLSARVQAKNIKILNDNFAETNDYLITPKFMVEELIKIKNRVMQIMQLRSRINKTNNCASKSNLIFNNRIELTEVVSNPCIIPKIRSQYDRMYPTDGLNQVSIFTSPSMFYNDCVARCTGYDSTHLLATLDFLINKYRCLADDRKILDISDDIGEEISDVVEEYTDIKRKMENLHAFNSKINEARSLVKELDQMSKQLKKDQLCEYEDTRGLMDSQIDKFQESLKTKEIEVLEKEAEQTQAKFNYYQKMANEITGRLQVIVNQPVNELVSYDLRPITQDDNSKAKSPECYVADPFQTSYQPFGTKDILSR
jgi:hypothetical protein